MDHAPEEYGEYWGGAIRMAAGVLLALFCYRFFLGLLEVVHSPLGTVFVWVVLSLVVLVACFAVALGLAKVIKAAVHGAG